MLPAPAKTSRPFRRAILATAILPAVLASSAFGVTNWNGPVALSTSAAPDDIVVQATSTVTLSNGGPTSITETSISFQPLVGNLETLTVDGPGLTLRSLTTALAIASTKTITINGTADFAPGSLNTTTSGGPALTGIFLVKNGGTGTLIIDDFTSVNNLAGTTLRTLDGRIAVFGGGGTANPLSTLTSSIELGASTPAQTTQAPILRFVGDGATNTTFANNFKAFYTSTIEHFGTTNDTISSASGTNGIATGKTLTVKVAEGGLNIAGVVASTSSGSVKGGILKKTGVDTTLTLSGGAFISSLNVAEGRVDVSGRFRADTVTFGAGSTLTLRNASTVAGTTNILPATIVITPGGTLEGLPGNFSTAAGQSILNLTGGTLNLGIGGASPGLSAHLYNGDDGGANLAFNTFANFSAYFAGRGTGLLTSTGANGFTELSFAPGGGDTAMFAPIAPAFTATNNIVSRFNGKIIVNGAGLYTFATSSDDGSMLYIDGKTVVANNFYQGTTRRTGTVSLSPGLHDIEIGFYEGGGANSITVDYSGPDTGDLQTTVPNSVLIAVDSASFLNTVTVTENSTINTSAASVVGTTFAAPKTLNVNGYKLDMGAVTLGAPTAGTYTINANTQYGQVIARSIVDGGLDVDLVNNGPGILVLESGASPQLQNAGSSVTISTGGLGVVLGSAGGSPTGNATVNVNGRSLTLSSKGGDQTYTPVGLSFTNGGSIVAAKIGSGVAGTTATPIRTTLNTALTVNTGNTLTTSTQDNYILVMPAISGSGTVSFGGTVETSNAVNIGALNVVDGGNVTSLGNITTTNGITLTGGSVPSRLNLNGGTVSGAAITVNIGAILSLGANDVLGNFVGGVSGVNINGGIVSAVAGTHSTLPAVTLNEGSLIATGPGNAPTGPTINYILNGNVTTVPGATPSTISAPAVLLRGAGTTGPVTFTVPRGTAETDLAVTSVIHDGGAGLIKNGNGIITLSGVNTYTGPTVINAGTVQANGSSALGSSPVTLNNSGVLSLGSPPSFAGFENTSLNGGATVDPTNSIVTLTTDQGGQSRSVFTQSKYSVGDGFSASFVYTASGARAADGITFTMQNSSPTALGGGGGSLGYVGIANSAALQLNIYTGAGQPIGTNLVSGTAGTYLSSAPVNLAGGNPIRVDVIYDSTALTFTEILLDMVTGDNYTHTFTTPALSGIIGGNLAYVGFTGATGGAQAGQTVKNFVFNDYSQQGVTLANNITVSASATGRLDLPGAGLGVGGSATLTGVLTLNTGSILDVTGGDTATDTAYSLNVTGSTTLAGNSTVNVANNGTGVGTLHLDDVNQSGANTSLTKTGAGTLVLSGTLSFAVLNMNAGTTDLDSALTNATINANGGTVNSHTSQTLAELNIGATGVVALGASAPPAPAFAEEMAGAATQAVPEPGSLNLLLVGALGWLARRQRPQRG